MGCSATKEMAAPPPSTTATQPTDWPRVNKVDGGKVESFSAHAPQASSSTLDTTGSGYTTNDYLQKGRVTPDEIIARKTRNNSSNKAEEIAGRSYEQQKKKHAAEDDEFDFDRPMRYTPSPVPQAHDTGAQGNNDGDDEFDFSHSHTNAQNDYVDVSGDLRDSTAEHSREETHDRHTNDKGARDAEVLNLEDDAYNFVARSPSPKDVEFGHQDIGGENGFDGSLNFAAVNQPPAPPYESNDVVDEVPQDCGCLAPGIYMTKRGDCICDNMCPCHPTQPPPKTRKNAPAIEEQRSHQAVPPSDLMEAEEAKGPSVNVGGAKGANVPPMGVGGSEEVVHGCGCLAPGIYMTKRGDCICDNMCPCHPMKPPKNPTSNKQSVGDQSETHPSSSSSSTIPTSDLAAVQSWQSAANMAHTNTNTAAPAAPQPLKSHRSDHSVSETVYEVDNTPRSAESEEW